MGILVRARIFVNRFYAFALFFYNPSVLPSAIHPSWSALRKSAACGQEIVAEMAISQFGVRAQRTALLRITHPSPLTQGRQEAEALPAQGRVSRRDGWVVQSYVVRSFTKESIYAQTP